MATPSSSSSSPKPFPVPHSIDSLLNSANGALTCLTVEHKGREYSPAAIDSDLANLEVVRANLREVKTLAVAAPTVPLRGRLCRKEESSVSRDIKQTNLLASGLHAAEMHVSKELITRADELYRQAKIKEATVLYSKALEANPHVDEFTQYKIKMIKEFAPQLELFADLINDGQSVEQAMRLIDFASAVAFEAIFDESPSAPMQQFFPCTNSVVAEKRIAATKGFLAKAIFLGEKDPAFWAGMFGFKELKYLPFFKEGTLKCTSAQRERLVVRTRIVSEHIEGRFKKHIDRIQHEITIHKKAHARARVHDPEVAVAVRIPIIIAQTILTKRGLINKELISEILGKLVDPIAPHKPYEKGLVETLRLVATSPEIEDALMAIKAPPSQASNEAEVIRTALHMDIDQLVSDADARIVAFSGILSHWRQAIDVGSCFVTSFAISTLKNHQTQCLRDFNELLQKGALSRSIDGRIYIFPYLLKTSYESFTYEIGLDDTGMMYDGEGAACYAWQIPALHSACLGMGIVDVKAAVLSNLSTRVFKKNAGLNTISVTPLNLLQGIADQHFGKEVKRGLTKTEAVKRGIFRYGAEIESSILRIWENSMAGMSLIANNPREFPKLFATEALITVMKNIIQSIPRAKISGEDEEISSLAEEAGDLSEIFAKYFSREVQGVFDPATLVGEHYNSNFILYDKKYSLDFKLWEPILTEEAFQQVFIRIIEKSVKESQINLNQEENPKAFAIAEGLLKGIKSPDFIGEVKAQLREVRGIETPSIETEVKELIHEAKTQYIEESKVQGSAFWVKSGGGSPSILLSSYSDSALELKLANKFTPTAPYEQAVKLVNLCRDYFHKSKEFPNLRLLVLGAKHGFHLLPSHPSLNANWKINDSVETWLQHQVIIPGQEIANSIINQEQRVELLQSIEKKIKGSKLEKFRLQIDSLPSPSSITTFRQGVARIIKALQLYDEDDIIMQMDDSIVEQILSSEQRQKFKDSVICFADTNWSMGVQDRYHGFCVNPGTGELGFIGLTSDKEIIWFEPKNWWITEEISVVVPNLIEHE